ncbi:MAG: IS1634 family transposase [Clostridiales bacterium]|nr:IS1634 family transposase [Clostridiales bacterium]
MYIRLSKGNTSKFTKVYLVEGYRDKNGKSKQRIVKKYGNLEELEAKDPNILIKLKAEAKKIVRNEVKITLNLSDSNTDKEKDKNYGYFFLEKIYKELGIMDFIKKYNFESKHKYDINKILKLLVYGRILNPTSKKTTLDHQDEYFEPFNEDLKSVYRSLSKFNELKEDLQFHLNEKVTETYGRDASLVFYDVTNYYFEIEKEDELKRKGMSKENKKSPIVQMGLLIDQNGLPIAYKLFPGNTNDISTLIPFLKEMREKYKLGRIIFTADKGLNSGKNLSYLKQEGDGYIVSQKVRGASKEFKAKVLGEEGYVYNESKSFKIKSFLQERTVDDVNGVKEILKEKVVCFWSKNYNDREKKKREELEIRIEEYLTNPSKYKSSNKYGIKKYLKSHNVNKETGEIQDGKTVLQFDREKYENDVQLDGYYAIITSEVNLTEEKIIGKYRGLWKIEESFKVIKSDLEGRPVYVRRNDHVEGHFLICFIALLIMRIIEFKLNGKYSIRKIQETLHNATCREVSKGIYSLNKQNELFRIIENKYNVSLDYKHVRIEQLRKYKKEIIHNI